MDGEVQLFPSDEYVRKKGLRFKPLETKVWTENKAQLVARYLKYFVFITHHGTYIDAFAGRQYQGTADGWAAELVLANEPAWLRHFYLFELDPGSHSSLLDLKRRHSTRDIVIDEAPGDCNIELPKRLARGSIRAKEASFCLLDQRTFECTWALCEHVAALKPIGERKVEQFYFLGQGWLDRAFAGTSTRDGYEKIELWWGRDDWQILRTLSGPERAQAFCERFKSELGYEYAIPWPIFKRDGRRGSVMYYMIHASDHEAAPPLMRRAYDKVLVAPEVDQLTLDDCLSEFASLKDASLMDDQRQINGWAE